MEGRPFISAIVPVHNGSEKARLCLDALLASADEPFELIVVDDASTDESAKRVLEKGVRLLRLDSRRGPAGARNHGAAHAAGEILFFVDADVLVGPETVARVAEAFLKKPETAAVFGSYDDSPAEKNFFSQYKNLYHHFIHQRSSTEAATFWSGCGAVRREVFEALGGFDAKRYVRPEIEDIELGYRMRELGYRIMLDKGLQVKHLKRWTLLSWLRADIFQRAVPWSRLILERGRIANDLNLRVTDRISALLAGLSVLLLIFSVLKPQLFYLVLFLYGLVFALNYQLFGFFLRRRGVRFAALSFPAYLLYLFYSGAVFVLHYGRHVWSRNRPATALLNS